MHRLNPQIQLNQNCSSVAFTKLVTSTGMELVIDDDLYNSPRFPFDFEKHFPVLNLDPKNSAHLETFAAKLTGSTYWLEEPVMAANMELIRHQKEQWTPNQFLGEGHLGGTTIDDILYEQFELENYAEALSAGVVEALKVAPPCELEVPIDPVSPYPIHADKSPSRIKNTKGAVGKIVKGFADVDAAMSVMEFDMNRAELERLGCSRAEACTKSGAYMALTYPNPVIALAIAGAQSPRGIEWTGRGVMRQGKLESTRWSGYNYSYRGAQFSPHWSPANPSEAWWGVAEGTMNTYDGIVDWGGGWWNYLVTDPLRPAEYNGYPIKSTSPTAPPTNGHYKKKFSFRELNNEDPSAIRRRRNLTKNCLY